MANCVLHLSSGGLLVGWWEVVAGVAAAQQHEDMRSGGFYLGKSSLGVGDASNGASPGEPLI